MKLYEIARKLDEAVDRAIDTDTGEIVDEKLWEAVNALEEELEAKAERVGLVIKELEGDQESVMKEEDRLAKRRRAIGKKIEGLTRYLAAHVDEGHTIRGKLVTITWRKSEGVVVDLKTELLAEEFVRTKVTTEPDKEKLRAALKSGRTGIGARMVQRRTIVVR